MTRPRRALLGAALALTLFLGLGRLDVFPVTGAQEGLPHTEMGLSMTTGMLVAYGPRAAGTVVTLGDWQCCVWTEGHSGVDCGARPDPESPDPEEG